MRSIQLEDMIQKKALFFISHSGGKDSQAMYAHLYHVLLIPRELIVVVHAHLGEVEWGGVIDHIKANIDHPLEIADAIYKDGTEKNFLNMVAKRHEDRPEVPCWPSPAQRTCTSDLKRGPIHKVIRRVMKERGATIGINCTGMRAQESNARAKLVEFEESKLLCNKSRTCYEWRPILDWDVEQVWDIIKRAGQEPFWAYADGNERLSCMFCILGSDNDLRHAARVNPELAAKYVAMEKKTGYTMFHKHSLESVIATDAT